MSDEQTRVCRCGAAMTEKSSEVSCGNQYEMRDGVLNVLIYWKCPTCGRSCTERGGTYADMKIVPREEWFLYDAKGWIRELGAVELVQVKGRGTIAVIPDSFPRFFGIGDRVDVEGQRFEVTGVEGSSGAFGPLKGVGLLLRKVDEKNG